jgi:hypothetical protein
MRVDSHQDSTANGFDIGFGGQRHGCAYGRTIPSMDCGAELWVGCTVAAASCLASCCQYPIRPWCIWIRTSSSRFKVAVEL